MFHLFWSARHTECKLVQVGKLHFEQVNYIEADRAFSRARLASPHCLGGMDVYSTVLYVSNKYSGHLDSNFSSDFI